MTRELSRAAAEAVVQAVRPGARLRTMDALSGGSASGMTSLELVLVSGATERLVLRRPSGFALGWNAHAAAAEAAVLARARDAGVPAPMPLHIDESRTVLPTPFLVLGWIDGAADLGPDISRRAIERAGHMLAAVHGIDGAGLALPDGAAFVGDWIARATGDEVAEYVRDLLVQAPRPVPRESPRLLHGDFWPANLLWNDGELVGVLDWEDAVRGDPLLDLAIARLDHHVFFGPAAAATLRDAYAEASGRDISGLRYWDLVAAVRAAPNVDAWAAGWAAGTTGGARPDATPAAFRERLVAFVDEARRDLREHDSQ